MIVMPVYQDVDALDVTGPFEMFRWANIPVVLVTETPGPITCNGSVTLVVTTSFNQAPAGEVLWVPGGHPKALNRLMKDETYLGFLRAQAAKPQVKWICSVCEGALLLAAAGLLDGYKVTTHWAFEPCFSQYPRVTLAGGHPRFHLDRNRLTGGGISSGLDEALQLILLLKGEAVAQSVQQTTQYYPKPPVTSEIPAATNCPLDDA